MYYHFLHKVFVLLLYFRLFHLHLSFECCIEQMQVGILKRVLEEVDKVMHEFRGMLYKSMEDPLLDLAEVLLSLKQ